jgi:hypothetical protein
MGLLDMIMPKDSSPDYGGWGGGQPRATPRGGLLDDDLMNFYRQQQFWGMVRSIGTNLMRTSMGYPPAGRGGVSLLPMLGLFGIFGRSHELQRLDQALRGVGLNPRLVPEAVKLTTLKLLGEAGAGPDAASYAAAAELLGYCVLGAQGFTECNDPSLTEAVEVRLATALEAGDNLDARVVLLTLHASVIQPSVVERYGLGSG